MNHTDTPKNIAVFASGNGSNAENIIRYFNSGTDRGASVALVVTNRPDAGVVTKASRLGVPVQVTSREELNNDSFIVPLMRRYGIDVVVLAGFLMMIPPFLVEMFRGRMVNIHPSLLPRHGGKGMFGHRVHEAVVAAGDTESGITIHLVSERYDEGTVLFQTSVALSPDDSPADVEEKIHRLEYLHYPRVIQSLVSATGVTAD